MAKEKTKQEQTMVLEDGMELQEVVENEEFDALDEYDEIDERHVRTTDARENAIEWYNGQDVMTVTLSQRRLINKVMALSKKFPNEVRVDKVNDDGTVLAHLPLSYLKFQRPRELSEEEKQKARERLAQYRKNN